MDAYRVLRENGTEWPFTSELLAEKRHGTFSCASCGTELFSSTTKYDSRTGWPSFFDAIPGSVKLQASLMDRLFGQREVRCGTCGGHLGHVFRDGPQPTGDRFCINGVVLEFNPESGPVIDVLVDE